MPRLERRMTQLQERRQELLLVPEPRFFLESGRDLL